MDGTLTERGTAEAVAGTGQVPNGAANRDDASGDAWKPARTSGRVQSKNEASLHAYSTSPRSVSVFDQEEATR